LRVARRAVDNPYLDAVRKRAEPEGADVVAVCAEIEAQVAQPTRAIARVPERVGLDELAQSRIRAAYHLLGLQTFFTAGPKEVRA
jgi:ribosome-binding ATPase YchF (GTP1/OBG family)